MISGCHLWMSRAVSHRISKEKKVNNVKPVNRTSEEEKLLKVPVTQVDLLKRPFVFLLGCCNFLKSIFNLT